MLIFRKAETFWGKQFYFSVFTFDFEKFLPLQEMKKHFFGFSYCINFNKICYFILNQCKIALKFWVKLRKCIGFNTKKYCMLNIILLSNFSEPTLVAIEKAFR